jgi:RNA polymerase sigma factor (sigma-70 family)
MDRRMTCRILIADDHELAREGLRAMLSREPDLVLAAEAANAADTVRGVTEHDIDIVLMDISFGAGANGLEATRQVMAVRPQTRVLMLTLHDTTDYVREAVDAGAAGYVLKDASRADLLSAIRIVRDGGAALPRELLQRAMAREAYRPSADLVLTRLTGREREVLDHVASGLTNKEIGRVLGISPGTVKAHVERIIAKLGVADRTQAAVLATQARTP